MATRKRNVFSQVYASVLLNAIYAMLNYPITLVNTLMAPLSILIIIALVSHGALLDVSIEGALIASMVASGISIQGDLSHLKNDFKLQDMIVSSPTSAAIYMAGMALSEIVYSLPAFIVLTLLAALFIHTTLLGYLTIFVILILMFIFSISLGFIISTFSSDVMQNWAFSGILSTLLTTIPPIYYTITYIPLPYRYIAYISPTTYAAEIVQNAIGALPLSPAALALDWMVIIGISAVLLFLAVKKNRWREA
jgi:ABC-2 type transport system permease protein